MLTLSKGDRLNRLILFLILRETEVLLSSVNPLIALRLEKTRPQSGPGRHQKLLLVRLHVNDAILVLHQVLEAWGSVEYGRDRHWRTHKSHEGHYYFNSLVIYYNYYNHNYKKYTKIKKKLESVRLARQNEICDIILLKSARGLCLKCDISERIIVIRRNLGELEGFSGVPWRRLRRHGEPALKY